MRRDALATASELHGIRGTVEGLRRTVALYTGLEVSIDESANYASSWSLAESADPDDGFSQEQSILGFTTMLAAADPQGAVLDTTAALDRSHLIERSDFGAPLFDDLAHRFFVTIQDNQPVDENKFITLQRIINREKPAHTSYKICEKPK